MHINTRMLCPLIFKFFWRYIQKVIHTNLLTFPYGLFYGNVQFCLHRKRKLKLKLKGARKTYAREEEACLPRALLCFVAPIFHATQSNNLVIVNHFKGYAFPVLKAIKYSCNIHFSFSALKVANSQIHFQSLNCKICKSTSRWFHLRAEFGNQHISLRPSGEGFRGGNENLWEIVASSPFLSPPLALASPFACCSCVTSRDSLK